MLVRDKNEQLYKTLAGMLFAVMALYQWYNQIQYTLASREGFPLPLEAALLLLIAAAYPVLIFLGRKDKLLLGLVLLDLFVNVFRVIGLYDSIDGGIPVSSLISTVAGCLLFVVLILGSCASSFAGWIPVQKIWFLPALFSLPNLIEGIDLLIAYADISALRKSMLLSIFLTCLSIAARAFLGLWLAARDPDGSSGACQTEKEEKKLTAGLFATGVAWAAVVLWSAGYAHQHNRPTRDSNYYYRYYDSSLALFLEHFLDAARDYVLLAGVLLIVVGICLLKLNPPAMAPQPVQVVAPLHSTPFLQPLQPVPQQDVFEEIKALKELLDSGILTQEEFDAKKRQLLDL